MELLKTVLGVLDSSLHPDAVAPSFEEMGLAIQRGIRECEQRKRSRAQPIDGRKDPSEGRSETKLTTQQQMVGITRRERTLDT